MTVAWLRMTVVWRFPAQGHRVFISPMHDFARAGSSRQRPDRRDDRRLDSISDGFEAVGDRARVIRRRPPPAIRGNCHRRPASSALIARICRRWRDLPNRRRTVLRRSPHHSQTVPGRSRRSQDPANGARTILDGSQDDSKQFRDGPLRSPDPSNSIRRSPKTRAMHSTMPGRSPTIAGSAQQPTDDPGRSNDLPNSVRMGRDGRRGFRDRERTKPRCQRTAQVPSANGGRSPSIMAVTRCTGMPPFRVRNFSSNASFTCDSSARFPESSARVHPGRWRRSTFPNCA